MLDTGGTKGGEVNKIKTEALVYIQEYLRGLL